MKRKYWLVLVLIAIGLTLMAGREFYSGTGTEDSMMRPVPAEQSEKTSTVASTASTNMPIIPRETALPLLRAAAERGDAKGNAQQTYATTHDFAKTYDQLLTDSTDPDAPYYAREIVGLCRAFYDPATKGFIDPTQFDPKDKLRSSDGRSLEAFRVLVERCRGWRGKMPTGAETRALLKQAILGNSPLAKATLVTSLISRGKVGEANAIATEVFLQQDGPAFSILSPVFYKSSPNGWTIGETKEVVPSKLVESVLDLASCRFGRYCGEESNELLYWCATTARCPRTIADEILMNPSLRPDERDAVQRYADIVEQAIRTNRLDLIGLRSGPAQSTPDANFTRAASYR